MTRFSMRFSMLSAAALVLLHTATGCRSTSSSDLDAVAVVRDGEVVLFYRDGNNIIVKACEDFSVVKTLDDCKEKPGVPPALVDVELFRKHLLTLVSLSDPSTYKDPDIKAKIELNKTAETPAEQAAKEEEAQASVKAQLAKIRKFTAEFSEEPTVAKQRLALESALAELDRKIAAKRDRPAAVARINELINILVDDLISKRDVMALSSPKDRGGFFFNILDSYLRGREPGADRFIFIAAKGKTFTMGSPLTEHNRQDDEKPHSVTLDRDFYISQYELTQGEWFAVMGGFPWGSPRFRTKEFCPDDFLNEGGGYCPNLPVEGVSWADVQTFLAKLNQMGKGTFRLPSEAEWEYAARAGTTTPFNLGNSLDPERVNFDGHHPYNAAEKKDGLYRGRTVKVGSLSNKNAFGLYDMHGNVWEWTSSFYGPYPFAIPDGPEATPDRVFRGGGWIDNATLCRVANRYNDTPDSRLDGVGFRLLRNP